MYRLFVLGVSAVALASAASVRAEEPAAAASPAASAAQVVMISASAPEAKKQTCWREYRVGSSFPVTHCETGDNAIDPAASQHLRDAQQEIQRSRTLQRAVGPS